MSTTITIVTNSNQPSYIPPVPTASFQPIVSPPTLTPIPPATSRDSSLRLQARRNALYSTAPAPERLGDRSVAAEQRAAAVVQGFEQLTSAFLPALAAFTTSFLVGTIYYAYLFDFGKFMEKMVEAFIKYIKWWVGIIIEFAVQIINAILSGIADQVGNVFSKMFEGFGKSLTGIFSGGSGGGLFGGIGKLFS